MAQPSFSVFSATDLLGFEPALSQGAWGAFIVPEGGGPLLELSAIAALKHTMQRRLKALAASRQQNPDGEPMALDRDWDGGQRALALKIHAALESDDPAETAAAGRLAGLLLRGESGTSQTQLTFAEEVRWGYSQLQYLDAAAYPQAAADIARLGLGDALARVRRTTDALANATGYDGATGGVLSPAARQKLARSRCADAFRATHALLGSWLEDPASDAEREQIEALLDPLRKLLDTAPRPKSKPSAEPAQEPTA